MNLLLDTHLLLWAAGQPQRLSATARALLENPDNTLLFSVASLWEISIKNSLGRADFKADARLLRRGLLDNGYAELAIQSGHVMQVESLPAIHNDPFDRILIAQAQAEGFLLLTADPVVASYPGLIRAV